MQTQGCDPSGQAKCVGTAIKDGIRSMLGEIITPRHFERESVPKDRWRNTWRPTADFPPLRYGE
jgi:hypothetical protein